jgi:hypothetical protein
VPLALGAGSLVLGGTAIGIHLWGNQAYDEAVKTNDEAVKTNDRAKFAEADKLHRSANNRRYAAQGVGLAAVACAGVAVYLYIRDRGADRGEHVGVLPVASPQFSGLAVAGSW